MKNSLGKAAEIAFTCLMYVVFALVAVVVALLALPFLVIAFIVRPRQTWANLVQYIAHLKAERQKNLRESYRQLAGEFMRWAIHMGSGQGDCIPVVTELLKQAKFRAKPVVGKRFNPFKPCSCLVYEGRDADAATSWMNGLTENLPNGDFTKEIEVIVDAIIARRAA